MMIFRFFLILLTVSYTLQTWSNCESLVPNSEHWGFARLILSSSLNRNEKISQLKEACKTFDAQDPFWNKINDYSRKRARALVVLQRIWTFTDVFRILGGTNLKDEYMRELLEIKSNPSAAERVRLTYELFLRHKTPFDEALRKKIKSGIPHDRRAILTPGQTLTNPAVCRDFASLLKYSLDIVSAPNTSKGWGPVFTSHIAVSKGELIAHMWVDVRIPRIDEHGRVLGFENISLDPTNFEKRYVPLPKLSQQINENRRQEMFNKCTSISICLEEFENKPAKLGPVDNSSSF